MSADARLHVRATVWGRGDNRIAVLLLDVRTRLPVSLPSALTARGLTLVSDVDHVVLPTARGWAIDAPADGGLTLHWPHRTPLLDQAAVERPGVWRWAARLRRTVLLLVGDRLGLDSDFADEDPAGHRDRLARAAAGGGLVGGAVPYAESDPHRPAPLSPRRRATGSALFPL